MVNIEHDVGYKSGRIIIRPNLSASWKTNRFLIFIIGFIAIGVAGIFSYWGAWLILPFAGLEILALYLLIYYVFHRLRKIEVISFNPENINLAKGRKFPIEEWQCQRYWCKLQVYKSGHPWYQDKLKLKCHANEVEIGALLNSEDKQKLAEYLNKILSNA